MRGVNPKRWFYGFSSYLSADADRVARVLTGPAAERWLTAELHGYLASILPPSLTCCGEDETADLTIYRVIDGDGAWRHGERRVASIEVRLMYRTYSAEKTAAYARRLCEQVRRNRDLGDPVSIGYLFGVFAAGPSTPDLRGTFVQFRAAASPWVRAACGETGIETAKPSLETVVDERAVMVGGVEVSIGLVGQYIRLGTVDDE